MWPSLKRGDTSLVSAVGAEQKIGQILEEEGGGGRGGGFVLATDQITSPHFSSDSKKNNPGFVSSCHVNPSDPGTPVRTKTDGGSQNWNYRFRSAARPAADTDD